MAGDWLKVEVATPSKAEVKNIASRLGITAEEAFGRLFRVWAWADANSHDGHVSVRDLSAIDDEARMVGFGQAMAEEGWAVPAKGGFTLPNFSRHNGKSAKKRALDTERKQKSRHESVRDLSASKAPREEKRRDTSSPSEKKARSPIRTPKCRMPEEFTETLVETDPELQSWNESKGFDRGHLPLHFEHFKMAVEKTDLMYAGMKGWRAAFRKAVTDDWAGIRSGKRSKESEQASWLTELTGGRNKRAEGEIIEGTAERSD